MKMNNDKDCRCAWLKCFVASLATAVMVASLFLFFPPTVKVKKQEFRFVAGDIIRSHPQNYKDPECKEEIYSTITSDNYDFYVVATPVPDDFEKGVIGAARISKDGMSFPQEVWICKHTKKIANIYERP